MRIVVPCGSLNFVPSSQRSSGTSVRIRDGLSVLPPGPGTPVYIPVIRDTPVYLLYKGASCFKMLYVFLGIWKPWISLLVTKIINGGQAQWKTYFIRIWGKDIHSERNNGNEYCLFWLTSCSYRASCSGQTASPVPSMVQKSPRITPPVTKSGSPQVCFKLSLQHCVY